MAEPSVGRPAGLPVLHAVLLPIARVLPRQLVKGLSLVPAVRLTGCTRPRLVRPGCI